MQGNVHNDDFYNENLQEDDILDFPLRTPKRATQGDTWTTSYADIVTVLLIFFILFYAIEKQIEKRNVNPVKGYDQQEGVLEEHSDSTVDTSFEYVIDRLSQVPNTTIVQTSTFVDIYFKEVAFFGKGGTVLTEKGSGFIKSVVDRLDGVETKYRLEVHGHTDKTRVLNKKGRWWKNNMELSVMRALSVYNFLVADGFPKEFLSVGGFGTNLSLKPEEQLKIINENRRISLRLQLIE